MCQWGHWSAIADAAEVFGEDFKNATGTLGLVSRVGRLADGPIAIAGDVSMLLDPPQSGAAGMTDRVMAGTNGVVVAGDTARALGAALGLKALADLSLGPVGVGIAVGTGLYLADAYAYAYRHWTWFRQDLAQPVGHASGRGGPLALGPPLPARVLELPDQLLLLGVHADHRITALFRLDQGQQHRAQPGVQHGGPLTSPAWPASPAQRVRPGVQLIDPEGHGGLADPGGPGHCPDPAVP